MHNYPAVNAVTLTSSRYRHFIYFWPFAVVQDRTGESSVFARSFFGVIWRIAPIILLFLSSTSQAAPSPAHLIASMEAASHNLNYAGRFVYGHNHRLSSLSILHVNMKGKEYARLQHLDGRSAEVLYKHNKMYIIHPGQNVTQLVAHDGLTLFSLPRHLAQHIPADYVVKLKGTDRVAGRSAWKLSLMPRDKWRYGYRLWLDKKEHLLLKSQVVSPDGQVLEQLEVTKLTLNPPHDESSFMLPDSADIRTLQTPPSHHQGTMLSLHADWLPAGFRRTKQRVGLADTSAIKIFGYSDGLATFTLFVKPSRKSEVTPRGAGRMGSTLVLSRLASCANAQCRITLIGELPTITAEKILANVRLLKQR